MQVTEQDSKNKWCPMVRASGSEDDNNASNAGIKQSEHRSPLFARCIGSECMMWVWNIVPRRVFVPCPESTLEIEPDRASSFTPVPDDYIWCPCDNGDAAAGWVESVESCEARRTGHCGLSCQSPAM